jgi:hypothetical protein
MILYILLLATGIKNGIYVFRNTESLGLARIGFTGAVVKVGLLLPLFTANVEIYTYVSWISWWMIGISVNEYSRIKKSQLYDSTSTLPSL